MKDISLESKKRLQTSKNRILFITFATTRALVAKLVDALDLGSSVLRRVGSSPIGRTKEILTA